MRPQTYPPVLSEKFRKCRFKGRQIINLCSGSPHVSDRPRGAWSQRDETIKHSSDKLHRDFIVHVLQENSFACVFLFVLEMWICLWCCKLEALLSKCQHVITYCNFQNVLISMIVSFIISSLDFMCNHKTVCIFNNLFTSGACCNRWLSPRVDLFYCVLIFNWLYWLFVVCQFVCFSWPLSCLNLKFYFVHEVKFIVISTPEIILKVAYNIRDQVLMYTTS